MTASFASWRDQGKFFAFRGQRDPRRADHRVFYQAGGTGGTGSHLLLVHGLPTASWDFHRIWPELNARCASLLAPDMLGFGWSDKPAAHRYSIFEQADLNEALLRLHGVTRFRLLAHDYGVTVAQELLARHSERLARGDRSLMLESVCFLNGGLFPETHRPLLIQRLMLTPIAPLLSRLVNFGTFKRSFCKAFGPNTQPSEAELVEFWQLVQAGGGSRVFHRLFHYMPERKLHRARWVTALQRSDVPLLLVNGPLDPISGAHMVARYRELVFNPDVVSLAGIGHYPHVEDPEGVLRALAKQL